MPSGSTSKRAMTLRRLGAVLLERATNVQEANGPTKPSHYVATDAARPSSAAPSLFFSQATPADNDVGLIASLGKGAHIGQHVPTLFLREAEIPRRHVRFAVMDSLEQVGIGFLSGRR